MDQNQAQDMRTNRGTLNSVLIREIEVRPAAAVKPPEKPDWLKRIEEMHPDCSNIRFVHITDEIDGMLFHTPKRCYKVEEIISDTEDYAVYKVRAAGVILPPPALSKARWLVSCTYANKWQSTKNAIGLLKKPDGTSFTWRLLDVGRIQMHFKKINCPEQYMFKIARLV